MPGIPSHPAQEIGRASQEISRGSVARGPRLGRPRRLPFQLLPEGLERANGHPRGLTISHTTGGLAPSLGPDATLLAFRVHRVSRLGATQFEGDGMGAVPKPCPASPVHL